MIGISIGIRRSAIWSKISAIAAGFKRYKSIIKKKKKKYDKIVFLEKSKWNKKIKVLISEALLDSNTSYDQFASINNALKEYNEMKEKIKKLKTKTAHQRF